MNNVLEEVAQNYQFQMKEQSNEDIYNQITPRNLSPKVPEVEEALNLISDLKTVDAYFFQKLKEVK